MSCLVRRSCCDSSDDEDDSEDDNDDKESYVYCCSDCEHMMDSNDGWEEVNITSNDTVIPR